MKYTYKNFSGVLFLVGTLSLLAINACQTRKNQARLLSEYQDYESDCELSIPEDRKYHEFLMLHNIARQYFNLQNQHKKRVFAVLAGDSIAALFLDPMRLKYLPGYDIANRGIGGDTSALLLNRIAEDALVLRPRIVIVSISGIDLIQNVCSENILKNVNEMLLRVHRYSGDTQVLVTSVPPVYEVSLNGIVLHYNARLRNLVAKHSHAHYIDLHSHLVNAQGDRLHKKYWLKWKNGEMDQVHFNEAGYQQWADLLKPYLKRKKH